jgi:hypothetical protein
MIDINLLPPQNVLTQNEKKLRSRLVVMTIALSIVFVLITVGAFIAQSVVGAKLTAEKQKQVALEAQFQSQAELVAKIKTVKDKALGLRTIRDSRTDFAGIMASIEAALKPDVRLSSLLIDNKGHVILSLTTPNVDGLDQLIARFSRDAASTSAFNKALITGLSRSAAGGFNFGLEMQAKSKL